MRPSNFIGLLTCLSSLFFAYFFLEKYLDLNPCPLCILDRMVLLVMGVVFLAGLFVKQIRLRVLLLCANMFALALGWLFAGRHVWVQNQPLDPNRSCLSSEPTITSFTDFIAKAFAAQADCILIQWEVAGLSIPSLTFLLFVFLLGLLLSQAWGINNDRYETDLD